MNYYFLGVCSYGSTAEFFFILCISGVIDGKQKTQTIYKTILHELYITQAIQLTVYIDYNTINCMYRLQYKQSLLQTKKTKNNSDCIHLHPSLFGGGYFENFIQWMPVSFQP